MAQKFIDLDGPKQGRLFSYGQDGGKGDAPRKGQNREAFRSNYDLIDWGKRPKKDKTK